MWVSPQPGLALSQRHMPQRPGERQGSILSSSSSSSCKKDRKIYDRIRVDDVTDPRKNSNKKKRPNDTVTPMVRPSFGVARVDCVSTRAAVGSLGKERWQPFRGREFVQKGKEHQQHKSTTTPSHRAPETKTLVSALSQDWSCSVSYLGTDGVSCRHGKCLSWQDQQSGSGDGVATAFVGTHFGLVGYQPVEGLGYMVESHHYAVGALCARSVGLVFVGLSVPPTGSTATTRTIVVVGKQTGQAPLRGPVVSVRVSPSNQFDSTGKDGNVTVVPFSVQRFGPVAPIATIVYRGRVAVRSRTGLVGGISRRRHDDGSTLVASQQQPPQ